jgi:hypothetical protein
MSSGLESGKAQQRRITVGSRGRALRRSVPVVMFSVFRSPVSRGRVSRRVFRSLSLLRLHFNQSINRSITHSHSHSALRDTARVAAATPYNVDRLQLRPGRPCFCGPEAVSRNGIPAAAIAISQGKVHSLKRRSSPTFITHSDDSKTAKKTAKKTSKVKQKKN